MFILKSGIRKKVAEHRQMIEIVAIIVLIVGIKYLLSIPCPILYMTGVPCPGCGMTRACICLAKLDFTEAFRYHPMCFLIPVFIVVMILKKRIPEKLYKVLCLVGIFLFLLTYIVRLLSHTDAIVQINIRNGLIYKLLCYI